VKEKLVNTTFTATAANSRLSEPIRSLHPELCDLVAAAAQNPRSHRDLRTFLAVELLAAHLKIDSSPARASTVCYQFADDFLSYLRQGR
jgi:hypothetical protein